jgi:thioredoxin 1
MELFNSKKFIQQLEENNNLILYFWSISCDICNKAESFILKLETAYMNKLKIIKANIQNEIELVTQFEIRSVPTFIIFKDKKVKDKIVGYKNEIDFEKRIRKNIL